MKILRLRYGFNEDKQEKKKGQTFKDKVRTNNVMLNELIDDCFENITSRTENREE